MDGGAALRVDRQDLPVLDEPAAFLHLGDGVGRAEAFFHQVECQRAEGGVGDVLRGDGAHAGPGIGTARGDGGGGGGDGDAEHARLGAAGDEGKGHASPCGITAVPSISTSHSGRASACTTSPVETGCTPLMYSPMVR